MTDPRFPRIIEADDPLPFSPLFYGALLWLVGVVGFTLLGWGLALFVSQWAHMGTGA